jgi:hypothetical protein
MVADDVVISSEQNELPTNSGVRKYSDFSYNTLFEGFRYKTGQALFPKKHTAHWYSILHLQRVSQNKV